ncbi:MAG: alanine--tRNA ligase [Chitinivibrionales bacterium]
MKSAKQIREEFIQFFEQRDHTFVKSSPVVPQDDPTLLFTNAGMNQFKAIFLGENKEGLRRAVNSQKCMRVSGKHNDLEEVGRDHHHHTFFEMLGNWSFGDYYKKEAITWAWELLTKVWKLPKQRLFVTVHHSDKEAIDLWKENTDIAPERILPFGDKDNFWEMGETGPCGPCSEIHYDMGDPATQKETFNHPKKGVNGENDRYREIWNLVFMQYNRQKDGVLKELPSKHVDTGMGFERVVSIIQGVNSNYDTDLFSPIIRKLEEMSGIKYSAGAQGTPFRVIADHVRALTFAITDGALPSNEGRGYVLRRLLRRAYRFGRQLDFHEPFICRLIPTVSAMMGEAFAEITQREQHVARVIQSEEERFDQTLEQGIEKFNSMVEEAKQTGKSILAGDDVFMLYDTFGFPMDVTRLMAQEQGMAVDEEQFAARMGEQRERARDAAKKTEDAGLTAEGWIELKSIQGTEFVGYETTGILARVARYKVLKPEADAESFQQALVILDVSPFYAESGGQTGDKGELKFSDGSILTVGDTFKWNDMSVLKVHAREPFPVSRLAEEFEAQVFSVKRNATRRNHSATHLLQAALRQVIGEHVQQSGSRVDPEGLRFDFTHFTQLSEGEKNRIEELVNEWILADLPVDTKISTAEQAKEEGATALFGEKYGEMVRVVSMGEVSKELCGGTHVNSTGQIGLFHILSESSISAGVRRIEAVTGMNTHRYLLQKEFIVSEICSTLKAGDDGVVTRVKDLVEKIKELDGELTRLKQAEAGREVSKIIEEASKSQGAFPWLVRNLGSMDKTEFSKFADAVSDLIREKNVADIVVFLAAEAGGKVLFASSAGKKAVSSYGIHCGELVREAARIAGGGGGGSPVRAQAGAKDPAKIEEALQKAESLIRQKAAV